MSCRNSFLFPLLAMLACSGANNPPAPSAPVAAAPGQQAAAQEESARVEGPIIDVHIHSESIQTYGPVAKQGWCMGMLHYIPPHDPKSQLSPEAAMAQAQNPGCPEPIPQAESDEALMRETLAEFERLDIIGVVGGDPAVVAKWKAAAPERVITSRHLNIRRDTDVTPEVLAQSFARGEFEVLGEVTNQYSGLGPDHPDFEPFWALAEKLDIPVGIHVGSLPPRTPYRQKGARIKLGDPLLLEEVLVSHPGLRVYVMHAGAPYIDHIVALMQVHTQLYVGTGVLQAIMSQADYDAFLLRLVNAGLGKRIMYGTDQMKWPGMIAPSIERVQRAPLSPRQKRDILYNNAARFFRLGNADTSS